jgi:hypothetical protein
LHQITARKARLNPAQYVVSKKSFLPKVRSTSRSRKESLVYHVMPDRYRLWFAAGSIATLPRFSAEQEPTLYDFGP